MQALTLTLSLPPVIDKKPSQKQMISLVEWGKIILIGWMRKNNRAARAAHSLVYFFDVVCQMTTSNFQMLNFNDNMNIM